MRTGPMAKAMKDIAKLRASNGVLLDKLDKLQRQHDRLLQMYADMLRESANNIRIIASYHEEQADKFEAEAGGLGLIGTRT